MLELWRLLGDKGAHANFLILNGKRTLEKLLLHEQAAREARLERFVHGQLGERCHGRRLRRNLRGHTHRFVHQFIIYM